MYDLRAISVRSISLHCHLPTVISHLPSAIHHPPSCYLPSTSCQLSFAICYLPSVIRRPPTIIHHLPSSFYLSPTILPSAIRHLPFVIWPSAIHHLPSVIWPSAIHHLPSAIFHLTFTIRYSPSTLRHPSSCHESSASYPLSFVIHHLSPCGMPPLGTTFLPYRQHCFLPLLYTHIRMNTKLPPSCNWSVIQSYCLSLRTLPCSTYGLLLSSYRLPIGGLRQSTQSTH